MSSEPTGPSQYSTDYGQTSQMRSDALDILQNPAAWGAQQCRKQTIEMVSHTMSCIADANFSLIGCENSEDAKNRVDKSKPERPVPGGWPVERIEWEDRHKKTQSLHATRVAETLNAETRRNDALTSLRTQLVENADLWGVAPANIPPVGTIAM